MRTRWMIAVVSCVLFVSACGSEPETGPEAGRALLDEVAAAMGGWDVLESIERQELIMQGNDWEPLQALEPGAERQINGFGQTILVDYTRPAMRLTFDGERTYPAPGPVRFTEVIDGDIGALLGQDASGQPTASRMQASRFATRMRDIHRLPRQMVFVARDAADLRRAEDRTIDGQTYEVLQYTDGTNAVEILIDPFNSLPSRLIYVETDPLWGDVENELVFVNWRESQVSATDTGEPINARLPFGQAMFLNGEKFREEAYRNIINNGTFEASAFDIPAEVRSAPEAGERVVSQWTLRRAVMGVGFAGYAEPDQTAELVEVAPGVLHAVGSSHHSMVVEMADHIIVVEAPLFEERSLAVIDAIEERFPDKPIRYAVVTHFHMDHSGGIRAYAANGATVVAHESIAPFLNTVLARPSTVRPDSLARATGVTPMVEEVAEMRELTDGTRSLQLHLVPNDHAAGMLMAYLPNERIAFVSDLYSPPAPVQADNANARAFYQAVVDANLQVDRVIGGHGTGPGPFRALATVMASN